MSFCGINFVPFQAKKYSCCPAKKMSCENFAPCPSLFHFIKPSLSRWKERRRFFCDDVFENSAKVLFKSLKIRNIKKSSLFKVAHFFTIRNRNNCLTNLLSSFISQEKKTKKITQLLPIFFYLCCLWNIMMPIISNQSAHLYLSIRTMTIL